MQSPRHYSLAVHAGGPENEEMKPNHPISAFLACYDKEKEQDGTESMEGTRMEGVKKCYSFCNLDDWSVVDISRQSSRSQSDSQPDAAGAEADSDKVSPLPSPTRTSFSQRGKKHSRRNSTAVRFEKPEYISDNE